MGEDYQCKVSKRLDLKIHDLGYLQQLLTQQDSSNADRFHYTTLLGEKLKFIRICKGHWLNYEYNIAIVIPT